MDRMAIISVDGHVTAPRESFRDYVERQYLDAFDEWAAVLDRIGVHNLGNLQPDLGPTSQWDSQRRVRDLEGQGVVAEVLFPNGMPFQLARFVDAGRADDAELTREGRRVYNRWLADFCAELPGRRAGQAVISFDDIDQAVRDVYWAKEHGLGGVMMPALLPDSRYFFDPALDPVWAACEETGLPVSQHGGTGAPNYSPPGYASIMTLALEHWFFSGRSLWQLIYGGVFDRFPGLQVVYVETEVDWVGRMIQKMDDRIGQGDDWIGFAKWLSLERPYSRLASEYWATNMHAGISPFSTKQAPIQGIVGAPGIGADGSFCLGTNRSMFGVDYPHFESIFPATHDAVAELAEAPGVTESDLQKILFANAAAVYGFDLERLAPDIERIGFAVAELRQPVPA